MQKDNVSSCETWGRSDNTRLVKPVYIEYDNRQGFFVQNIGAGTK